MPEFQVQQDHSLNNESGFYSRKMAHRKEISKQCWIGELGHQFYPSRPTCCRCSCAFEPGPQTQRSFRKEGSCPQLVQLAPPKWSLGEFPVVSRLPASDGRQRLPHSRLSLEPDTQPTYIARRPQTTPSFSGIYVVSTTARPPSKGNPTVS